MKKRSLLMLSMADPLTDRRAQNFKRLFEGAGWIVELLAPTTNAKRGPRRFIEYHQNLKRMIAGYSADVVLACDLYSLSATRRMKQHGKSQLLLYDAREVYTELPTVARKPLSKLFWKWVERRGLAATDVLLTTGPRDIQAICDVHSFLPRPVLVRNLPWRALDLRGDRRLLKPYGIPSDAKVLVYVGGLQEGRGLEILLKALSLLPPTIVHVLLIGDGILRPQLERNRSELGIESIVHFAGALPSDEALRLAAACDVGLSLIEPISRSYELALPSKLFEYMMCGIPVVSSRLEQVTDLFEKEGWITFVDVSDPNSIQKGIEAALANAQHPALRERLRSLALSEYHFEHDAAKLLTLLDTLLPG
ncbi:MAG TPA: glycosyltransferase [Candidatus Kapabacteria bacterium]|nr:glycosyltransferase [Candidatus Kapabacteria bacterium]